MVNLEGIDSRMIANNLTPFEPTHPGMVVKDEIEFRGISQRKLAEKMSVSNSVLNEILNGKRPLTTEYALMFEAVLGIDAEPLLVMQSAYEMQTVKQNKSFAARLAKIRDMAAIL